MKSLTPRQARFVDEYLIDGNGSAAYRRAGYSVSSA
ncbi:MAG: terminase small subunit [Dehalococcoidia bacterium]|nr:terminase small subunit [Dehalococcoidia bacterium]